MKRHILLLFFSLVCSCALAQTLGKLIDNAYTFDQRFPRETVCLHLDNASYIQGDTLWYKAYVVRASTLRPDSTLSRTLYVELLNDAGTLLQRSILRLDSIGQAHGNFPLTAPLQNGFYEIRAYTRAMTNWTALSNSPRLEGGHEASAGSTSPSPNEGGSCLLQAAKPSGEGAGYFSKVFPLFELPKKALPGDFTQLDIQRPESELDFKLEHARPYDFGSKNERRLEYFAEGGSLAAGIRGHVAYRLTDGHGLPADDSIAVYSARGTLICKSAPEYEGMGTLIVPEAADGMYAQVVGKRKKHPLPSVASSAVALHAYEAIDEESGRPALNLDLQPAAGMVVPDEDGDEDPLRAAVVLFSREVPYKVYSLELDGDVTTLVIDRDELKAGINRIEVVDAEGLPLASRLLYAAAESSDEDLHKPVVTVRQNAESYEAYDPIAIELELKDADGQPMPFTQLSVSVRDERGDLILDDQPSLATQLNFAGELQGYVHQPEAYLRNLKNSKPGNLITSRPLDLLMQVQGWRPETMEQLCMTDSFVVRQPMEDCPIIRGRIIKDDDRMKPYANMDVGLTMYNKYLRVLRAATTTDHEGIFTFESHDDFRGDFTTEFSVKNEGGNKVWHRVMLDQWFAPKAKKYSPYEMQTLSPSNSPRLGGEQEASAGSAITSPPPSRGEMEGGIFEWTDTIPRVVRQNLGEAVVKHKKPFVFELVGQEFDRYNYGGGEDQGIRHSDTYFNVDLELQRIRDAGIDVFTIREFLCYLIGDKDQALNPDPMIHGATPASLTTHARITESLVEPLSGAKDERGVITPDKVDGSYDNNRIDVAEGEIEEEEALMGSITVKGRHFAIIYNNGAGIPVGQLNMQMPEQLKSVIVSYNASWASKLFREHVDGIIYVYTRPDWYLYNKFKKGVTKRTLHGFTEPDEFKGPDYRRTDPEDPEDFRRTLYWNPCLTTDADGRATAIFYANARWRQHLRVTVRGITADGRIIEYDR